MAICKGALCSETASGRFGTGLIFANTLQKNIVRFNSYRKRKRTNPQKVIRVIYGEIISDYRILTDEILNEYKERAKGESLSALNIFYKEFFNWTFFPIYNDTHYGVANYE